MFNSVKNQTKNARKKERKKRKSVFFSFLLQKLKWINFILLVLLFKEIGLSPELSSSPFQNPGRVVWAWRANEGRKSFCLIVDLLPTDLEHHFISQFYPPYVLPPKTPPLCQSLCNALLNRFQNSFLLRY